MVPLLRRIYIEPPLQAPLGFDPQQTNNNVLTVFREAKPHYLSDTAATSLLKQIKHLNEMHVVLVEWVFVHDQQRMCFRTAHQIFSTGAHQAKQLTLVDLA